MKINKHSDKQVTALLKINMFHSLYQLSGGKNIAAVGIGVINSCACSKSFSVLILDP